MDAFDAVPISENRARRTPAPPREPDRAEAAAEAHAMEPWHAGVRDRLREASGELTYRALSDALHQNPETVRRYLVGANPPSVAFVAAFCDAFDVSADWLLLGRWPMRFSDRKAHILATASLRELLSRAAEIIEHRPHAEPASSGAPGNVPPPAPSAPREAIPSG